MIFLSLTNKKLDPLNFEQLNFGVIPNGWFNISKKNKKLVLKQNKLKQTHLK